MTDVTQILSQIEQGDPKAAEQLLPLVYGDPFALCCLARTCSLSQGGISDPATQVRWGQIATEADPGSAWYVFSLGIAQYRAGDFAVAEKTCENSPTVHQIWLGREENYAVLAMVCQRCGQTDRACEWLAQAQESLTMLEQSRAEWKYGMAASDYLSDWLGPNSQKRKRRYRSERPGFTWRHTSARSVIRVWPGA